jgi:hypothetical protein
MIRKSDKLWLPIPTDCVSLSRAREMIFMAAIPENDVAGWVAREIPKEKLECRLPATSVEEKLQDWLTQEIAQEELDQKLRAACVEEKLKGLVLNLELKQFELPALGWRLDPVDFDNPGFQDDFVAPGAPCRSGPDTTFGTGKHRPVFFAKSDFDRWLKFHWLVRVSKFPTEEPAGPKEAAVWREVKAIDGWSAGPPDTISSEIVRQRVIEIRKRKFGRAVLGTDPEELSLSTVQRAIGRRKFKLGKLGKR